MYVGIGSGVAFGSSTSTTGCGTGATEAPSGCVRLCSLKQGIEQLRCVSVDRGDVGEASYYGRAHVGHLYFLGALLQTPHALSAIFPEYEVMRECDRKKKQVTMRCEKRAAKTRRAGVPPPLAVQSASEKPDSRRKLKVKAPRPLLLIADPTMSFPSSIRPVPRFLESWTCSSCSRGLPRAPRPTNVNVVRPRRCLNTTRETPRAAAPSMDEVRQQYKANNRTTMYAMLILRINGTEAHAATGTTSSVSFSALLPYPTALSPCTRWYCAFLNL